MITVLSNPPSRSSFEGSLSDARLPEWKFCFQVLVVLLIITVASVLYRFYPINCRKSPTTRCEDLLQINLEPAVENGLNYNGTLRLRFPNETSEREVWFKCDVGRGKIIWEFENETETEPKRGELGVGRSNPTNIYNNSSRVLILKEECTNGGFSILNQPYFVWVELWLLSLQGERVEHKEAEFQSLSYTERKFEGEDCPPSCFWSQVSIS